MARKKNTLELSNFLSTVLQTITKDFTLDEAILYGSYAKGNAHELSDIDLAVVSPELNKKSIYGNSREITKKQNYMKQICNSRLFLQMFFIMRLSLILALYKKSSEQEKESTPKKVV
jgi:predicted nucleotidyltransferase